MYLIHCIWESLGNNSLAYTLFLFPPLFHISQSNGHSKLDHYVLPGVHNQCLMLFLSRVNRLPFSSFPLSLPVCLTLSLHLDLPWTAHSGSPASHQLSSISMHVHAQLYLNLCYSMDHSPQGSSVHGILQARILEWIAVPSSRDLPHPGMEPTSLMSPAFAGRFFPTSTTWEALVIMPILSEAEHYASSHEPLLHPLLHMLLVL